MEEVRKHKILIIDDERTNLNALTYILKPKYSVFIAKYGLTALNVVRSIMPDLILLDVVMPGMSGFEVIAELKSSEATKNIPVMFITGRDSVEDEETGLSLGAVDYVGKPFHNSIVLARVKTHLQIVEYIRTIEHLSMIDPLTDLPNRRSFDLRITSEWNRAVREKTSLSLLMIDLDRFKKYNDLYGHKQGDILLKTLANTMRKTIKRASDCTSRWGGEEFAVLLPNTDLPGAVIVAEDIRLSVLSMTVPNNQAKTSITISIGVNTTMPAIDQSIDEFFTLTDRALYHAKETGRNRVCTIKDLED